MMIGPEPITSTWRKSVRRGTSAPFHYWRESAHLYGNYGVLPYRHARSRVAMSLLACHEFDELVEQIFRIVRTGGGLRVVLHRKRPSVSEPEAFHHAVVGAGMTDHRRTERCVEGLPSFPF